MTQPAANVSFNFNIGMVAPKDDAGGFKFLRSHPVASKLGIVVRSQAPIDIQTRIQNRHLKYGVNMLLEIVEISVGLDHT